MATLVAGPAPPTRDEPPPPSRRTLDAWPHTHRPMPWLIALFMVMVYVFPFDSTTLPISLPFNAGLDRVVLVVVAIVWLVQSLTGQDRPRFRHSAINLAMYLFVIVVSLSVIFNLRDLAWDQELSTSFKQSLLAFTYLIFFYIVASSLHREELPSFCKLLVVLGCLSAIGTVLEYRAHVNLFAHLGNLVPSANVALKAAVHDSGGSRAEFGGPTKHGLSDATMLDAALPFAMVFLARARGFWPRTRWGLAIVLLAAGCISTGEKTAFILLIVSIAIMVAFRPRRFARFWPLPLLALLGTQIVAPDAISSVSHQFSIIGTSNSTTGRTSDYSAVAPFLNTHLLFGRGFGSYLPGKYRILDDYMLLTTIETGAIGVLVYAAVVFSPVYAAWRRARRGLTLEDDLLAGIVATCIAFFLTNFLYDAFSFRQGPYVFFFIAGLTAATVGRRGTGRLDRVDRALSAEAS